MVFHALNGITGLYDHTFVFIQATAHDGTAFYLHGKLNGCLRNCSHVESILSRRGGRKGSEKQGSIQASPHALCWHAERDDVAESPMEILTQTLMSGKELVCVCVWISRH